MIQTDEHLTSRVGKRTVELQNPLFKNFFNSFFVIGNCWDTANLQLTGFIGQTEIRKIKTKNP